MVHGRNLMILIYWISAKHAWIGLQRTETWFAKKSTWDATVRGDYYMLTELKLQLFNALLIYLAFSMKFYCLCCQSWEALWWWTRMNLQHWLVVCYLKPICWWLKLEQIKTDFFKDDCFYWVYQNQFMAKLLKSLAIMLRNLPFSVCNWISLDRFLFHGILWVLLLERMVKQSKEYKQKLEQKCSLIWVSSITLPTEYVINSPGVEINVKQICCLKMLEFQTSIRAS